MWKTDSSKAYLFRHKHPNHYSPSPREAPSHLSTCFEDREVDEEVPIVFMMPEQRPDADSSSVSSSSSTFNIVLTTPTPTERRQRKQSKKLLASLPLSDMPSVTDYFASNYMNDDTNISAPPVPVRRRPSLNLRPVLVPPRRPLPSLPNTPRSNQFSTSTSTPTATTPTRSRRFLKDGPSTPSSHAPEKMTNLLTEVLNNMNSVMEQQHTVKAEDAILADLTQLVVIMQEEAEALLHLSSLVEEFVEEVDIAKQAAEIEDWVKELGLDEMPEVSDGSGESTESEVDVISGIVTPERNVRAVGHGRDDSFDSALGLDDESPGHARNMGETVHQAAIVQIAQLKKDESDVRRGNIVEIGKRAMERSEGTESMPHAPRTPRMPQSQTQLQLQLQPQDQTPPPRAQYLPHRKPSFGLIKVDKAELYGTARTGSKKTKSRKDPPPPLSPFMPLSPFRDSALVMSPNSISRMRPKGKNDMGLAMSPRWI